MKKLAVYLSTLSTLNNLGKGAPVQWCFHSGMLFYTFVKWWGDFTRRQTAHEGIDITYYRVGESGGLRQFNSAIRVPAMEKGKVIRICNDFLGRTIVVEIPGSRASGRTVVQAYAHIVPLEGLETGDIIKKNQVIATVSDTHKNPQLPPHLHFSCFEIPPAIPYASLDWRLFSQSLEIMPINPVFL